MIWENMLEVKREIGERRVYEQGEKIVSRKKNWSKKQSAERAKLCENRGVVIGFGNFQRSKKPNSDILWVAQC